MVSFSEIDKRGGSNKACSWKFFLKKNKKNSKLLRDFRVGCLIALNEYKQDNNYRTMRMPAYKETETKEEQ